MKKLLALMLLLPSIALADSLIFHTISQHSKPGNWNEVNYGIGYREKHDRLYTQLGVYKNSVHKTSFYMNFDYALIQRSVELGVFAGMATGYRNTWGGAGAFLRVPINSIDFTVRIIPGIAGHTGVTALEIGVEL